ncbi:hypothetical protein KKH38_00465 [Patescibacteria group bacterium]|nr:hypothetical protein [Patescibacteria group bacterium]MBU4600540.1 hypothetical protein [Patescibacteria group bacterium]MCG2697786.1 hypothetical protein [Candidatus Parcubacteria bacterium]
MINTLTELYSSFDELLDGISEICKKCSYYDCMGYLWLLPDEAKKLLDADIELLTVNNGINFINPFKAGEEIDIERFKPICPWFKNHLCRIRSLRPLVCRMYPLNFAAEHDNIYLVLHLDCEYAKINKGNKNFQQKATDLFRQINTQFFQQILNSYRLVNNIIKFPRGPNRYLKLANVRQINLKIL